MPYTILLIDDDNLFRKEFCECFDDFEVLEASTGEEALGILKKANNVDIALLDVVMPGQPGTEILKKVKKIAPDLPVIMLTGYSSKDIAVESLKGHADDYLEKPIDIDKTRSVIEKTLGSKSGDIDAEDIKGKIKKVKEFIEKNVYRRVNLADAANVLYLSPKYLSRIFKEVSGENFNSYKTGVKLEKAKELLLNTSYTVSQIAYKLAYENVETFTRQFKKIIGKTPATFRHSKQKSKTKKKKK